MASSKTLEQAIAGIIIWRKGEQRAPHKPLLLLYVLANYQQGHARLFDYGTEVHEKLLSRTLRSTDKGSLSEYAFLAAQRGWILGSEEY
jgi:predicted restriction endonuclease